MTNMTELIEIRIISNIQCCPKDDIINKLYQYPGLDSIIGIGGICIRTFIQKDEIPKLWNYLNCNCVVIQLCD